MCSITEHDRQKPTCVDDTSSGDGRAVPKNSTISSLQSLGDTLKFIDS